MNMDEFTTEGWDEFSKFKLDKLTNQVVDLKNKIEGADIRRDAIRRQVDSLRAQQGLPPMNWERRESNSERDRKRRENGSRALGALKHWESFDPKYQEAILAFILKRWDSLPKAWRTKIREFVQASD